MPVACCCCRFSGIAFPNSPLPIRPLQSSEYPSETEVERRKDEVRDNMNGAARDISEQKEMLKVSP